MSSIEKINRDCPLWEKLTAEVNDTVKHEPDLEEFFAKSILNFSDIESSISYVLANQLQQNGFDLEKTQSIIYNAFISEKNAYEKIITDINTVFDRDQGMYYLLSTNTVLQRFFNPFKFTEQQIIIGKRVIKLLLFIFNQEPLKYLI